MSTTTLITRADAEKHGLHPVVISVDASGAGLFPRTFPGGDMYLRLQGPPGGPLGLIIWDRTTSTASLEEIVRETFVPVWGSVHELSPGRGRVVGFEQEGVTFKTGEGVVRAAWFAFLISTRDAKLLIAFVAPGGDAGTVDVTELLSNSAISTVIRSLTITD